MYRKQSTIAPKGSSKDFSYGVDVYIKETENDQTLTTIEKAARISTASNDIRQYINQTKIISSALSQLAPSADAKYLDMDWLAFFMEYAKNIGKEEVQEFWAKLLAKKINGEDGITKKLINILAVIGDDDIDTFCKICSMTFDSAARERSKYPFIYIKEHSQYYNSQNIRRYHLRSLADLGLIHYDLNGFVLPKKVPLLKYHDIKIRLTADTRIDTGNIVLTPAGKILYDMTEKVFNDKFIFICKRIWDDKNIQYEIIN